MTSKKYVRFRTLEVSVKDWSQVLKLDRFFSGFFIYRGQSNSEWPLSTSIDRYNLKYGSKFFNETEDIEKWMLYNLKKKYSLYAINRPKEEDHFEWLSILQHYKAPTRLIDFTKSLYIALFFAAIDAIPDENFSVFGLNNTMIIDQVNTQKHVPYDRSLLTIDAIYGLHCNLANGLIAREYDLDDSEGEKRKSFIISLEPKIFSERIARQQGLFVMPSNPFKSFERNLNESFEKTNDIIVYDPIEIEELISVFENKIDRDDVALYKINFSFSLRSKVLQLLRQMNISDEILFPGLEGLSKSLIYNLY